MLVPHECEGIKVVWFSTNISSIRVAQFKANPEACLYFFDARFFRGVMLRETMKVLTDAKNKKRIRKTGDTMSLPRRRDRPGLLRPALHGDGRMLLQQLQVRKL
jgi:general stress protein 26